MDQDLKLYQGSELHLFIADSANRADWHSIMQDVLQYAVVNDGNRIENHEVVAVPEHEKIVVNITSTVKGYGQIGEVIEGVIGAVNKSPHINWNNSTWRYAIRDKDPKETQ